MKRIVKIGLNILTVILASACLFSCSLFDKGEGSAPGADFPEGDFKMTVTVSAVGEKLTVEVLEAEYAYGTHLVVYSDDTPVLDKDGSRISISDVKVGDKLEVTYSGQIMMSLPPQVAAVSVRRI